MRKSIWLGMTLVAIAVGYVAFAAVTSHAADVVDGVVYWPSYHDRQQLLRSSLTDPTSAQFRDLYFRKVDGRQYLCGQVNARNRMGGYNGFQPFYAGGGMTVILDPDDAASSYTIERICTK